jgi:DNA-binding transcriptional MerR regulator
MTGNILMEDTFTIQQVADATNLSVHTLRYYERVGLIHPIDRAENTHRRYTQDDIGLIF